MRYMAGEHQGGRLDADSLAELLWPSSDPRRSRHSLRQAVSEIGKVAPELNLHIRRGKVEFAKSLLTSDVSLLEAAAKDGDCEQLLTLYHTPPEVEDVGGRKYVEWQESERDRVQGMLSHAISHHIRTLEAEASWAQVERFATVLLKFECDEDIMQAWITAITLQNDHDRARREARALRLTHGDDLSSQCIAFLTRVETEQTAEATVRSPGFVGRRAEFQRLIEAWKGPSTRAVLLQGDGGIGKTTLANHFLRYAALQGATCIVVVCDRHRRHIPYATIFDIINAAPARLVGKLTREQADVLRVIAKGAIALPEDTRAGASTSTADEVGRILETMFSQSAETEPIVLFFDDAQHADASSLESISDRFGCGGEPGAPLLLFASRNLDETGLKLPVRFGARIELINLDRLDTDTVNAYIDAFETRNKLRLSQQDRTTVARVAGGEPFYLETLLSSIATRGRVQELQTAGRLTELIQQRIEPLSDVAMSVLGVIACAGRPITLEPIITASALSESAALRAVEDLLRARLVEESKTQIVVAHELIGEAVTRLSARFRTQLYHRRLAEHFETVDTPDHSFLAYQYERADRLDEAYRHLLAAAAHAEKFLAVTETEALLRRAVDNAPSRDKWHEARRKLAGLFLRTGRFRECVELSIQDNESIDGIELECALAKTLIDFGVADDSQIDENSLNKLIEVTDQIDDHAIQIVALNEFLVHAYGRGNGALISALIDRVETMLPKFKTSEQARIRLVFRPLLQVISPERDVKTDSAHLAFEAGDWRAEAKSLAVAGRALMLDGRPGEACQVFAQAQALLEEHDAQELFTPALPNYALALWQKGDLGAAANMLERGRSLAIKDVQQARLCTANLAALRYELGNVEEARKMAHALFEEKGTRLLIHLAAASMLGLCALAQGDTITAEAIKNLFKENKAGADLLCLGHHPSLFLARYALLTDSAHAAISILDETIERERTRDVPAAMALRLERARIVAEQDHEFALSELTEVETVCGERGLHEHDARIQELKTLLGIAAAGT